MPETSRSRRPTALAVALVILGIIGFVAAFELTVEKFHLLENPGAALTCDFNILVQCAKNLSSPQGAIFGFPNPILGLAGWTATIGVGVGILAGARYSRWFWVLFNLGTLGALVLVIWLISQSIFVLGTLCPWCMVTWVVTIPTFLLVTLHNLSTLPGSAALRRRSRAVAGWIPAISIGCYLVIAVIAQLRLDVLSYL